MSGFVARGVEGSLGFRGERLGIQWFRAENFGSGAYTGPLLRCRVIIRLVTEVMEVVQRVTHKTLI